MSAAAMSISRACVGSSWFAAVMLSALAPGLAGAQGVFQPPALEPGLISALRTGGLDPRMFARAKTRLNDAEAIKDRTAGCVEFGRAFGQVLDSDALKRAFFVAAHWEIVAHPETAPVNDAMKGLARSGGDIDEFLASESAADDAESCVTAYQNAFLSLGLGDLEATEKGAARARRFFARLADSAANPSTNLVANVSAADAALYAAAHTQGVRVALLIANARYQAKADVPPLRTPPADVALISATLHKAGFGEIVVVENAGRSEMVDALRRFQDKADRADTALIYYAGHGMQSAGENYAIPIDARLADERSIADETVSQARLMQAMVKAAKLKILIMDACRDNPFGSTMQTESGARGVTRGLVRITPPKSHMIVVYSASSGQEAQDGTGPNSPFAAALSQRMLQPGVDVTRVFGGVEDDVLKLTNGAQQPDVAGYFGGDAFYFVPPKA